MEKRIVVGLAVIAAVVEGLAPGVVPENLLPLALVVLGLVYGSRSVDAEDSVGVLAVAIAAGAAANADVLSNIHMIGGYLDSILDQVVISLYGGVVAVLVVRTINRLKG